MPVNTYIGILVGLGNWDLNFDREDQRKFKRFLTLIGYKSVPHKNLEVDDTRSYVQKI